MRGLFFGILYVLFVSVMPFLPETQAAGTSYYVAPNSSGSSCTRQSPCSLDTGLSKATPGNEVVLLDGVYRGLRTKRSGTSGTPIVIRAENRHKAVIEWPYSEHRFGRNVSIEHSHIVLRDLKIDGKKLSWDNLRIGGDGVQNVIVEGNMIVNGGHMAVGMFHARNVIFRFNFIETMGQFSEDGEGFYLSSANGDAPVVNVEIYGNVIRNITANYIDYKGQARNVNVHHNIFERHRKDKDGWSGDGLIRSVGSNSSAGNFFRDNIVRDSPDAAYTIRLSSNRVDVLNNVFVNIGGNRFIDSRTTESAVIRGNTLCNTPTGGDRGGNNTKAPQSACDAEVKRILDEMTQLSGNSSGGTPDNSDNASGIGTNLVSSITLIAHSNNFHSNYPVERLWDGCTDTGTTPPCLTASDTSASYWVEFDFGRPHTLTSARLFGDANGSWQSQSWTFKYKANQQDPWITAFASINAAINDWITQNLADKLARYVRVEVEGNPEVLATEARELEVYGMPAIRPPSALHFVGTND